jgi:hypothetical protein
MIDTSDVYSTVGRGKLKERGWRSTSRPLTGGDWLNMGRMVEGEMRVNVSLYLVCLAFCIGVKRGLIKSTV